jgi:hypothetical protein
MMMGSTAKIKGMRKAMRKKTDSSSGSGKMMKMVKV